MNTRRVQPGQTEGSTRRTDAPTNSSLVALESFDEFANRAGESVIHGGFVSLATEQALNDIPTDLDVTLGIGKIMVVVNAGTDIAGTITVTGTSVDRSTGVETGSDTETITVDALSGDTSSTDANGNAKHAFTGAYLTTKWFRGDVTLSTTDLTLTDVDVYNVAFEQLNDSPDYVIQAFDITLFAITNTALFDAYIYTVIHETDGKVAIAIIPNSEINLGATDVDHNYRLRRAGPDGLGLGVAMDGTRDGFFVSTFVGAPNRIEDLNVKVWCTVNGSGTRLTALALRGAATPASVTDNALVRWDGTDGKSIQNSGVVVDDSNNMTGMGTVDGRDVAADGTKLDTIETSADVTDSINVAIAGAVMQVLADAKADLIVGLANDAFIRLAVGTNDQVLTAASGETTGLKWADAAGGGLSSGSQIAEIMSVYDVDNADDKAAHGLSYDGGASAPPERYRVISFADDASEFVDFLIRMYDGYDGTSGISARIPWLAATAAASRVVEWFASFRRLNFDGEDLGAAFDYTTDQQSLVDDVPSTQGNITQAVIPFTSSEINSLVAGELGILRIWRDPTPASGTNLTGDALMLPAVQLVLT